MEQYITKNHCPCHIQVLETRGRMLTAFKSWFVAWYGHFLWNCPNIYPHRFLLLLCQRLVLSFFPVDDHLCFGFPRIVLHVVWNKFFQSIYCSVACIKCLICLTKIADRVCCFYFVIVYLTSLQTGKVPWPDAIIHKSFYYTDAVTTMAKGMKWSCGQEDNEYGVDLKALLLMCLWNITRF